MTFILICFVSELFAWSFPPTIPLTSASSEVNELVLSPMLRFIRKGEFLAELGIRCFKSGARIRAYLSRKSSSQSKPLLLMLNGDYAAGTLGSGINAGATGGRVPWPMAAAVWRAGFLSRVARVPGTSHREQHLVWACSDTGS